MHSETELPASYRPAAIQIQLSILGEFIDSESVKIHRPHLPLKALSALNRLQTAFHHSNNQAEGKILMKNLLFVTLVVSITACTTTPTIQQGPDAELSFDGLVAIDNSVFQRAWIDPDIDLSVYDKIMPGGAEFEFRAVRGTAGTSSRASSRNEFPISDEGQQRLIDTVSEIFKEELSNSQYFTITDTPGDDVLVVKGALLDIVSRVPPERVGRSDVFLSSVGEATLVLELRDSVSGETIYRAADRRAAEAAGGRGIRANTVTTWNEVRRLARRWATRLRDGLDSTRQ